MNTNKRNSAVANKKLRYHLVRSGGAKLTDAQYKSYLAGNLYVNVHSAAHKGGEVRAQLSPK